MGRSKQSKQTPFPKDKHRAESAYSVDVNAGTTRQNPRVTAWVGAAAPHFPKNRLRTIKIERGTMNDER